MKLYATIENEKGKKDGLGGDEYLDIDIRVGNQILAQLTVRHSDILPEEDGSGWCLFNANDEITNWIVDKTGKKQKGKK